MPGGKGHLNVNHKEGLKLFWSATGNGFLVATSRAAVEMFMKHKFNVIYRGPDARATHARNPARESC